MRKKDKEGSMSVRAFTCDEHGWGQKKDECVVCGKRPADYPAFLCDRCGREKDKCCICERPAKNLAMVCKAHQGMCAKCGNPAR